MAINKPLQIGIVCLTALIVAYVGIRLDVDRTVKGYIVEAADLPPSQTTAVVLGAQVQDGTIPSPALAERLQTAIALYKQGKAGRLLMSGDNASQYYNEVKVMKQYAESNGVPAAQIDTDGAGYRTYDSCYRLENVYHFDRVILITQPDHLERAVYTCRELGLNAIGVSTDSGSTLLSDPEFFWREQGAVLLAWLDINLLHPVPTS